MKNTIDIQRISEVNGMDKVLLSNLGIQELDPSKCIVKKVIAVGKPIFCGKKFRSKKKMIAK